MYNVTIAKDRGLRVAEAVFNLLGDHADVSDHSDLDYRINVEGYTAGSVTGYHFSCSETDRACNVTEERVTDGIVFNYGRNADYDYNTNQATDATIRLDFKESDFNLVAKHVIIWLTLGRLPSLND